MGVQAANCELCDASLGDVIVRTAQFRVILVDDASYPGFCRVIWNTHVREMTDLDASDRNVFMQAVWQVEAAVRQIMQPHKMNLASLGNMVPHLHWHIIPRYADDAHFPNPVWATARAEGPDEAGLAARRSLLPLLRQTIITSFQP
ncbi:HIT family protein [Undibacterium sp. TS12]|uniref:HIT family protein n=1 Tax=Undibacterium sp. TS12 TaxID=2908202 RepID=UPI001F4CF338|nr:HIT family protein [Undibacterium sp. TS12]MCH8619462.1 HIT family protein [Undibacterium sp. TS12]